jgi:cobalt/nickel transport protein
MKRLAIAGIALAALLLTPIAGMAHFGMVIPSRCAATEAGDAVIRLNLKFWHPFANMGMDMEKPAAFQVFFNGNSTDMLSFLEEGKEQGRRVWSMDYAITRPGLYVFALEPAPYFEKAEDSYIVHHTKAYVEAFGLDDGWDKPLGLKAEIVPLVKPGGLYAGNQFRGQVLRGGKHDPYAEVEVEWYPGPGLRGIAPHAGMETQAVKADADGVFSYTAPAPGWWGFAALKTAEETLPLEADGKIVQKPVEEGAVIWIYFHAMPPAVPVQ